MHSNTELCDFIESFIVDTSTDAYRRINHDKPEINVNVVKHCKTGKSTIRLIKAMRGLRLFYWQLETGQYKNSEINALYNLDPVFSMLDIGMRSMEDAWELCYLIAERYRSNENFILPRDHNFFFKTIPEPLLEILDGCLAGDGGVYKHSSVSSIFQYALSRKQRGHVEELQAELQKFGYSGTIKDYENVNTDPKSKLEKIEHSLLTWSLRCFNALQERWYVNKVKRLPNDVRNTPTFWRWFYAGDGCLYKSTESASGIYIAANDFTTEEVDRLIDMLSEHEIAATKYLKRITELTGRPQWTIAVRTGESTRNFIKMIGPPIKSIEYKWAVLEQIYIPCENCNLIFPKTRSDKRFCSVRCLHQAGHRRRMTNLFWKKETLAKHREYSLHYQRRKRGKE